MLSEVFYPEQNLTEVRKEKRPGVLMTVKGPFGMTEKPNKNGRIYSNSLWEKVLGSEDTQRKLKERAIFGEPDHPNTLYPTISKASHIVTKIELDKKNNVIMGEADIIDTPGGRIIKAIYGS